jgi:DNA repair exonuclease SbcCD ATPase subunit
MIVRRIAVEHFGRFLQPLEVALDPARPNLLAGPNGSGKSTLLAALTSAFTVSVTSAAQDIKRWQPWQRNLFPRVTVEFEHAGSLWRLQKEFAFSSRGKALLECFEGGQWRPHAQGKHVEERLPEFLGAPQGGPGSWLVAGALWARQNELAELRLDQPLQERIRNSLGAQIRSGLVDTVLRETKRLYDEDWPPEGRLLRRASPIRALEDELTSLRESVRTLQDSLDALENDRIKLEKAREESAALEVRKSELEARLRDLGEKLKLKTELDAGRLELEKSIQAARFELDTAASVLRLRQTIAADLDAAAKAVSALEERLQRARADVKSAEDAWIHARAAASARAAEAEAELRSLNAPPRDLLDRVARLDQQLRELQARLDGALLHVQLQLEAPARIGVQKGSPEGVLEGRAGETLDISGSPEIELVLPGFGRMRIWGPSASVEELRGEIGRVRLERDQLTQPWGAADLNLLEEKRRQADALENEAGALRKALAAHESGASLEAVSLARARDAVRDLEEQLRQAHDRQRALQQQKAALDSDPRGEAALQQAKEEAARRLAVDEARLRELLERLALLPAGLDLEKQRAESELARLQTQLEQARELRARLSERIRQKQGEGAYARLAEAEEQLAAKQQEYDSALRQARANRLLWQTLNDVLEEAEGSILPRLEERTIQVLSRINGGFLRGVRLDRSSWKPDAVTPAEAAGALEVAPDRISGGEQEQLHFALRLALADILSESEPQLVVLDDVLLATDSARLGRILDLIEERRPRMQFLILTCHPERFSGLEDARLVRLGALDASASA